MSSKLLPLLTAVFLAVSCQPAPVVDQCKVNGVVEHSLSFQSHPNIANSPNFSDTDPDNDYTDLDESLHRVPGEYALTLKIGAAAQPVQAVADTGSSDLVVLGSSYKPGSSATSTGASIPLSYGSCNGNATQYKDLVGLACGNPFEDAFAYLNDPSSRCPSIMGLAYPNLARSEGFFDALVARANIPNMFSMLLCGINSGSQIVLGGDVANAPIASLQYTPIVEESWYVINAKSLSVKGGQSLGSFTGAQTILDSGTTLNIIPSAMHANLVNAIRAAVPSIPAAFFTTTNPSDPDYVLGSSQIGDLGKWPTLQLSVEGTGGSDVLLEIPPQVYVKNMGGGNLIFGFRPVEGSSIVILGQPTMENYYVVFDRANKRIGFAPNTGLCGAKI